MSEVEQCDVDKTSSKQNEKENRMELTKFILTPFFHLKGTYSSLTVVRVL
jgi:hypothetical protein